MHAMNCWKHFENTGKIEDYLSYKGIAEQNFNSVEQNQLADNETQGVFHDKVIAESKKPQGAEPYAGFY